MSDGIKGLVNCVSGKLSKSMESEYKELKMKAATLQTLKMDIDSQVKQETTKTGRIDYQTWRDDVQCFLKTLEEFKVHYEQRRNRWPICINKSDLSEELEHLLLSVQLYYEKAHVVETLIVDKPPQKVVKMRPPDIKTIPTPPDIKTFPTLQGPLQKMLQFLSSERGKVFGIWGPLGVGKSTIMQNLKDHEEVENRFDIVIWIEASMESSKEKLQEVIARQLKLNLLEDKAHPDMVAESIHEELEDKKYLLLLDGVNDFIHLPGIGIRGNNKGSKVVLTTECRHVCHSMATRMVKVNPLSSDEAWLMFQQIVADKSDLSDVTPIAQQVAAECGGFPLLINLVANSFKWKNSVDEWRNSLEELRNCLEVEIPGLTKIHSTIKFCYNDLKDEKKKICLLYVALHPAGTKISADYLVKCWAAERFLGNIDNRRSFRTASDRGYAILGHLSNVALLHVDKKMDHVQVNNLVRQVALHISSEKLDCKFLTGVTKTSTDPLDVNDWEQAKRIFMIDAKIEHLPRSPQCSMLLSLLLQKNPGLKTIPRLFFGTMKKLLVLNLYRTGIETLPPSLECLTELKALFLNECGSLKWLPLQIEQLHFLEVLDIRGCKIIFIPPSIGKLVYLRCLKVSYHKPSWKNGNEDMQTDCDVISRLSMLEELVIDVNSYAQWCIEATDVIQHVASLEKLTSLKIHFPKMEILNNLLQRRTEWQGRQKLASFWFFVGHPSWDPPEILDCFEYKINRYLRYCHDGNDHNSTVSNVFPETDALELIGHDNIRCLLDFMQAPGLNRVRGCLVERCNSMGNIVDGSNASGIDILSALEQMHLRNLPVLSSILEGPRSQGSLSKLQTMVVKSCPKLTKISSDASLGWPQLKELRIYSCPELKRLPFNKENAAELKLIEGEQAWWDALVWENDEIKEHFQSIFIPKVSV